MQSFGDVEYSARSLYEAAYLYAVGVALATVTGKPGSARFVFDNKDGMARRVAEEFYADASIGARTLFEAAGQLKRQGDQIPWTAN